LEKRRTAKWVHKRGESKSPPWGRERVNKKVGALKMP